MTQLSNVPMQPKPDAVERPLTLVEKLEQEIESLENSFEQLAIVDDESEVKEKEVTNDQIKELALAYGFKLKEQPNGEMDLNPYVYDFARAIGGNQHPNRKHIKHLIDNLELGKAIILNEQNFKFDNEIALANFKFGIMVADLIYCSDDSAIDRE